MASATNGVLTTEFLLDVIAWAVPAALVLIVSIIGWFLRRQIGRIDALEESRAQYVTEHKLTSVVNSLRLEIRTAADSDQRLLTEIVRQLSEMKIALSDITNTHNAQIIDIYKNLNKGM